MFRFIIPTLALTLSAASAQAEVSLSVPLETGATSTITTASYSCAGAEPFTVQYVNAGANILAILPIDGESRIFANVLSGSGARYASGPYIWWSKGETATLENELEEGSLQDCVSQDIPAAE